MEPRPAVTSSAQHADAFPFPEFITRVRREVDPVDAINARQFENWQCAGKHPSYDRPDLNKRAPMYDMAPNTSRTQSKEYRTQPRYDVDAARGVANPFFAKYDTTSDPRNMTRELRGSVYEDKNVGYATESAKLLERNFDQRWLSAEAVKEQARAAEALRPLKDDIRVFYGPTRAPK